jgi:hypothetical protein
MWLTVLCSDLAPRWSGAKGFMQLFTPALEDIEMCTDGKPRRHRTPTAPAL